MPDRRTTVRRAALAVALMGGAVGALAQPILLDFEGIPAMPNSPGVVIPPGARLSDAFLASHGVRFSSTSPFVAVVVHGAGTPSGINLLGGSTADGRLTYDAANPVRASFFDASGTVPRVVTDVSIRGDLIPISGNKRLIAFDVNGVQVGIDEHPDSWPDPLRVRAQGIHSVIMTSDSATVGWDDLRFDEPRDACPADFNGDGFLDFFDYDDYVNCFETGTCPPGRTADINGDGFADFFDYDDFVAAFERGC